MKDTPSHAPFSYKSSKQRSTENGARVNALQKDWQVAVGVHGKRKCVE